MKSRISIIIIVIFLMAFLVYALPLISISSPEYKKTGTNKTFFEVNSTIIESNLGSLIYNWNGTNFTMYDDSLVLMMNFDNSGELISSDSLWDENLVGAWHLNNNTYEDARGNYNGTAISGLNCTGDEGKFSEGCLFNGVNEFIDTPTSGILRDTIQYTISVWTKPVSFGGWKGIVSKYLSDTNCITIQAHTSGAMYFDVDNGTTNSYASLGTGTLSTGNWYHIVAVYNGSGATNADKLKVYIDNIQKTLTFSGTLPSRTGLTNTANFTIGKMQSTTYYNGNIDEVLIWNRSLSPLEVTDLYNRGLATDYSKYGNGGIIVNATYNSTGKYGGAYSFNYNSYINVTSLAGKLDDSEGGTISWWSYNNGIYNDGQEHGWWGWTTSGVGEFNCFKYSDNKLYCGWFDYSPSTDARVTFSATATNYPTGAWSHYTFTWTNGAPAKFYQNGQLIATGSTNTAVFNDNKPFFIGFIKDNSTLRRWNGSIDEFRIWNVTLNASEVYQQYISSLQKFNSTQWNLYINQSQNATTGLSNGTYPYQIFATNTSGSLIYSSLRKIAVDQIYPIINFTNSTPTNDTTINSSNFEINVSIIEGDIQDLTYNWNRTNFTIYNRSVILMLNFNNKSSLGENDSYVVDISNEINDGIVYGAIWNSSGKFGGAYQFDGVDDLVNITGLSDLGTSQSMWIKNSTDSKWYFVVNSSGTTYIDGTAGTKDIPLSNSTGQVVIGGGFNGSIDEVIIWNRNLSSSEINQFYMTNLYKFNSTLWYFYSNQTQNSTSGLDNGNYTYQILITDLAGQSNQTEQRNININVSVLVVEETTPAVAETPTTSSGGGGNYILEQNTKTEELKIRTWISPNKTLTAKIKDNKRTGIKEIELKSKNWLSGEIFIVAYNETPNFCHIKYQEEHKVYKVLDFNTTIKNELIDSGRLRIGIQKDWIYSNNVSEIKFVRCSPKYEEVKSSYESETDEEGIYDVYINGFSTYAILGTFALDNISEGEKIWNAESKPYSFSKIFLLILISVIVVGLIILLVKHRIYLKEKRHSKFFDFEFKFRIGK
jgi:hypothetical protein